MSNRMNPHEMRVRAELDQAVSDLRDSGVPVEMSSKQFALFHEFAIIGALMACVEVRSDNWQKIEREARDRIWKIHDQFAQAGMSKRDAREELLRATAIARVMCDQFREDIESRCPSRAAESES